MTRKKGTVEFDRKKQSPLNERLGSSLKLSRNRRNILTLKWVLLVLLALWATWILARAFFAW
ncbi:hypothetical protein [Roseovarius indicus]|uniref:hypothetical protein n=1 Tax=Roseovarius indicus TaxID=540747 RepID=UPI0032EEC549